MRLRFACPVVAAWLLAGCEVVPSASWQVITHAVSAAPTVTSSVVGDPRFEYLQLERGVSSLRLVLGYRTLLAASSPSGIASVEEHWYSGDREMLVLRDGRLDRALGMAVEWRATRATEQPDWDAVVSQAGPRHWQRQRDEMPGYRYGVVDAVTSRRVDAPFRAVAIPGTEGEAVVWVQDDVRTPMADGRTWSHSQWFALVRRGDRWWVRWSRQCLAPDWCLDLTPLARAGS